MDFISSAWVYLQFCFVRFQARVCVSQALLCRDVWVQIGLEVSRTAAYMCGVGFSHGLECDIACPSLTVWIQRSIPCKGTVP
jgi:hypothetical protein